MGLIHAVINHIAGSFHNEEITTSLFLSSFCFLHDASWLLF